MFIFNLNGVFTKDFLKMAPSVCALARDFLQEEDFTGRKLRRPAGLSNLVKLSL
jgi:hypothetical protein